MTPDIIKERHSVRQYLDRPIDNAVKEQLEKYIAEWNALGGTRLVLVTDEPDAFGKSILAGYGKFSGVKNYICLIGDKSNPRASERLGYVGEHCVLKAQQLGLNTCWVGLTVKRGRIPVELLYGEKVYAVIAVGYGADAGSTHKMKTQQAVAPGYDNAPDWFRRGVDMALLAPTAMNQQKFRFELKEENSVHASHGFGFYTRMDLGIVKCHFEIGAAPHTVVWS